jgi:Fe2+ transport system protein FeoA
MKLTNLDQNNIATVTDIEAGKFATQRIMDMGLCIGTSFKVISKLPNGPIEVEVRGTMLVIGGEIANKIIVNKNDRKV